MGETVTEASRYGQISAALPDFPNIVWISGNDSSIGAPTTDPDPMAWRRASARTRRIADGRARYEERVAGRPLLGSPRRARCRVHLLPDLRAGTQGVQPRADPIPAFMVEANYEFEKTRARRWNAEYLRHQEYWSLLSGASGQLYGNRPWHPLCSQCDRLGTASAAGRTTSTRPARAVRYAKSSSRADPGSASSRTEHTVVTAGLGTSTGTNDYATAAITPDGGSGSRTSPSPARSPST